MALLYDDLSALMERLDRVLPQQHDRRLQPAKFCPSLDMIVENTTVSVHRVSVTSNSWRMDESHVPLTHTKHTGRRWYASNKTKVECMDRKLYTENGMPANADKPEGIKVWHASDSAKRLFLLARHDMDSLFRSTPETPALPLDSDEDSITLLITPAHTLGVTEGIALLKDSSPYVVRLCNEYAKMACWLYNLSQGEFSALTQMSISRHTAGKTAIMQRTGGGYHDSGPILIIGLGVQHIQHDFIPSLMKSDRLTPVRITIAEGDMMTLDGYARSNYAHGYTHLPTATKAPLYTINFYMDCMRKTVCIGYDPITRGVLMETPVDEDHIISTMPNTGARKCFVDENPTIGLVRSIRSRLQEAESILLSSKYTARVPAKERPPSLQGRTCHPPSWPSNHPVPHQP